ncbi:hypothetical protein [Halopseudomonas salina]|uniref:Uncharacterized protein n=1 Tax=Halopseudomonas salina TaxID=1323744 RepID=A0ABQ1NY90_9GAMM|nr:hypothetical protein [Halopseudomonas salina]GGC87580.1 hypothetical protein GCM10007418_04170 [Halopseudomonas salina]
MDWKGSPVIISIASGAAGIGFAVQFLFPSLNAQLNYDHRITVDSLTSEKFQLEEKLNSLRNDNKYIDSERSSLKKDASALKEIIESQQEKITELELGRILDMGNPYPVSFPSIKIFDEITRVQKIHKDEKIEKSNNDYWIVKVDHALFDSIIYYYAELPELENKKVIYQISYVKRDYYIEQLLLDSGDSFQNSSPKKTKFETDDKFFIKLLDDYLGVGQLWPRGDTQDYSWLTAYGVTVYMTGESYDRYTISQELLAPGTWRHPIPQTQYQLSCPGEVDPAL